MTLKSTGVPSQPDEELPLTFDWARFWHDQGREIHLDGDGFLEVLGELRTLDELEEKPFLVLLGEQGIGKTYETIAVCERLRADGRNALRLDLQGCQDKAELKGLLEREQAWQEWCAGQQAEMHLYLDSLDEGYNYPTWKMAQSVGQILRDLGRRPEGLRLRIACRSTVWARGNAQPIEEVLGRAETLEMALLSREDVWSAAGQAFEGQPDRDPIAFLEAVTDLGYGALAAKPVTLDLLFREYSQNGSLTMDRAELFRRGILKLCEEGPRRSRRMEEATWRRAHPNDLFKLASRVAAVTALTRRPIIGTGTDVQSPSKLLLGDVVADSGLGSDLLADLPKTGLFSRRGSDEYAWAHSTYEEYLAAAFVAELDLVQIKSLLRHPSRDRLISGLENVAAWVASLNARARAWLVQEHAPELIFSAIPWTDEVKEVLVSRVLALSGADRLDSLLDFGLSYHYLKLIHPGLKEQLLACILDRTQPTGARLAAIDMAAATVEDLSGELLKVALDPDEPSEIRQEAVAYLRYHGTAAERGELAPLVRGERNAAEDFRLAALQQCWPQTWTCQEMLAQLWEPAGTTPSLYRQFLSERLIASIPEEECVGALQTVESWPDSVSQLKSVLLPALQARAALVGEAGITFESLFERVLAEIEQGEGKRWVDLCRILNRWHNGGRVPTRITDIAAWPSYRNWPARVPQAALRFLNQMPVPDIDQMTDDDLAATLTAIRLLVEQKMEGLAPIIKKWALVILHWPASDRDRAYSEILSQLYADAPEAVIQCLLAAARSTDEISPASSAWKEQLCLSLGGALGSAGISENDRYLIAAFLMEEQNQAAVEAMAAELRKADGTSGWLADCACLLARNTRLTWEDLRPLCERNDDATVSVLSASVAQADRNGAPFLRTWSSQDLEQLLSMTLPVQLPSGVSVGLIYLIAKVLVERHTEADLKILRTLARQNELMAQLLGYYLKAAERANLEDCRAPEIKQVLGLMGDKNRRYVAGPDQLMEVLLEALERMSGAMRGGHRPVQFVWTKDFRIAPDELADGEQAELVDRPRVENEITDFIALWLAQDLNGRGIVLNREVEFRRGLGKGDNSGQRGDLLAQTVVDGPGGRIVEVSVVLEVKGCWHGKLKSAMETQLVEEYLKKNKYTHGIYVVLWCWCDWWTKGWNQTTWPDLQSVINKFREQAQEQQEKNPGLTLAASVLDLRLSGG